MSRHGARTRVGSVLGLGGMLLVMLAAVGAGPAAGASTPPPAAEVTAAPGTAGTTTYSTALTQPLVVIVDLSSSMLEDDGAGTVRLDGAKVALSSLVRRQPTGAEVGLWTYPSPSDSCGAGGYVPGAEIGPVADPGLLSAKINALKAAGDTPTAAALTSVADSLRARDITGATLLLVSDGESNCGIDPCEVAQQISDEGFDLTVQAMGFQISQNGRSELECIAAATNGRYYDVRDSAELATLLDEVAVPRLALDVTAAATVTAGMATTIRAQVSNSSAQATEDVSVSLVFTDDGSRTVFPAVVPPRYRLGNIPGGATVVREWTLSTAGAPGGTGVDEQSASWRVTAWATDVGAVSQTGSIAVRSGEATLDDAGPVLRDLSSGPVVVLGDSYSSGEGAGDYLRGTDDESTLCHRSMSTYGVRLVSASRTEIVACSGAVTANLETPQWDRHVSAQLDDVADLADPPSVVLMTIGGNDIGFANIIMRCVYTGIGDFAVPWPETDNCNEDPLFVASTARRLSELGGTLEQTYVKVWDQVNTASMVAARGGYAPVIVLAYPQVLPQWQRGSCQGFSASEIDFGNRVVAELDRVAAASVAAVQQDGYSVYFASDVHGAVLPRHTACDPEPFINPVDALRGYSVALDQGRKQELLHPDAQGYDAMTNALLAWSQTVEPVQVSAPAAVPVRTVRAQEPAIAVDMSTVDEDAVLRVEAGRAVDVTMSGLVPGTTVTVVVHSTPRVLGSLPVDEDGTAHGVVYVPADLEAGAHRLSVTGLGPEPGVVERSTGLSVLPPRPAWLPPLVAGSGVLLLGGVVLLVRGVRLRRTAPVTATTVDPEDPE